MLKSHIKTNFDTYTSKHRVKTSRNSNPIASFVIEARLGLHSCHIIGNIKVEAYNYWCEIQELLRMSNSLIPFPFATDILDINYLSHKQNFSVNRDKK